MRYAHCKWCTKQVGFRFAVFMDGDDNHVLFCDTQCAFRWFRAPTRSGKA